MDDELVETITEIEPVWIPDSLVLEWPFGASDARPITYLRETPKRAAADAMYKALKGAEKWCDSDDPVAVLWEIIQYALALADGDKGDDPHQEAYDEFNATALAAID